MWQKLTKRNQSTKDGEHMVFTKHTSVMTPGGKGKIVYARMAPPDYSEVAVYSVLLDNANHYANYSGSIYPAEDVKEIK